MLGIGDQQIDADKPSTYPFHVIAVLLIYLRACFFLYRKIEDSCQSVAIIFFF